MYYKDQARVLSFENWISIQFRHMNVIKSNSISLTMQNLIGKIFLGKWKESENKTRMKCMYMLYLYVVMQ